MVSMLPSYFISLEKEKLAELKMEIQKQEPLPLLGEQALSVVTDINKKLKLVEDSEKNKFLLSIKVINAIILQKTPSIKITQISYENDVVNGKKISINGIASSRETLLLFSQILKNNPNFKNVNLPISNFVKGSNIQFYLSLIPS